MQTFQGTSASRSSANIAWWHDGGRRSRTGPLRRSLGRCRTWTWPDNAAGSERQGLEKKTSSETGGWYLGSLIFRWFIVAAVLRWWWSLIKVEVNLGMTWKNGVPQQMWTLGSSPTSKNDDLKKPRWVSLGSVCDWKNMLGCPGCVNFGAGHGVHGSPNKIGT